MVAILFGGDELVEALMLFVSSAGSPSTYLGPLSSAPRHHPGEQRPSPPKQQLRQHTQQPPHQRTWRQSFITRDACHTSGRSLVVQQPRLVTWWQHIAVSHATNTARPDSVCDDRWARWVMEKRFHVKRFSVHLKWIILHRFILWNALQIDLLSEKELRTTSISVWPMSAKDRPKCYTRFTAIKILRRINPESNVFLNVGHFVPAWNSIALQLEL